MDPELRLETIAAHFFVSPQYLSTLFSQESHSTLSSYINTFRMHRAKEFLLQQSPSIQNTAALCGFTDAGYFSKCFKKIFTGYRLRTFWHSGPPEHAGELPAAGRGANSGYFCVKNGWILPNPFFCANLSSIEKEKAAFLCTASAANVQA